MSEELLAVEGLVQHFHGRGGLVVAAERGAGRRVVKAVDGVDLALHARRDARPGRRVRLRQVHAQPLRRRALHPHRRRRPLRRAGRCTARPTPRAAPARADGVPGPVQLAQPADDRRARRSARCCATTGSCPGPRCATRVRELVDLVGLPVRAVDQLPRSFSGGQRQRIGIARALALEPRVLIADEPVSALDVSVQATIINLLLDLKETLGLSMLFVSHNMAVVRQISDRIAVMHDGVVVEEGDTSAVFQHPSTTTPGCCSPRSPGIGGGRAARARRERALSMSAVLPTVIGSERSEIGLPAAAGRAARGRLRAGRRRGGAAGVRGQPRRPLRRHRPACRTPAAWSSSTPR